MKVSFQKLLSCSSWPLFINRPILYTIPQNVTDLTDSVDQIVKMTFIKIKSHQQQPPSVKCKQPVKCVKIGRYVHTQQLIYFSLFRIL